MHTELTLPGTGFILPFLYAEADNAIAAVFEPLINADEAASLLGGIHPKTLMRKTREGLIPGYRFARAWFYRASELDAWLQTQLRSIPANHARPN